MRNTWVMMVPVDDRDEAPHRHLYPRVTSFRSRRAALTESQDRAWQTMWPQIGQDVAEARIDPPALFGRTAPLILEIGFGTGTSTAAMAAAEPDKDVLAVEVYLPGIAQLLGAVQREQLTNVRVIRGDSMIALEHMIAPHTLTGMRVFFPDPWPKARHHKRRLLQSPTLELMATRIIPGGVLHVATDHEEYAEAIAEASSSVAALRAVDPSAADLAISTARPVTKFEKKGRVAGRPIAEFVWEIRT